MSFNPDVPLNADSPALFPAQNRTNMGRLQAIIEKDHQFNLSLQTNDGYHNLIHMIPPSPAPTGASAGIGRLYTKISGTYLQLFYMDDNGTEYQVTPGVVAAVNFDGTGSNGAKSLRSSLNVASVTKSGGSDTYKYRVAFTTPISNANYIVQVTGMRQGTSSGQCCGQIYDANSYSTSVTTTYVDIGFNRGSSSYIGDVLMGNVIIYAVS